MSIRRVLPDIRVAKLDDSRAFYGLLGFEAAMDLGWAVNLVSPSNPTAQVMLIGPEAPDEQPDFSVEVADVDAVHAAVAASGAEIVYALRDEPWGVRRFFVRDPDGQIVNVLSHL